MPTKARMQAMAARMINQTWGDMRGPVVLVELGDYDYTTQTSPTINTDNTQGIRENFTKSQVDGEKIQVGDFQVLVLQQGLTVDIRSDNTSMTFKGVPVSIEFVDEDAAEAIYTLQVRVK